MSHENSARRLLRQSIKHENSHDPVNERRGIVDTGFTQIPSFVFRDRSVAVLESLVEYLHDIKKLSYHEIAILLNRNDRTIWTVYNRVKLKRKGLGKRISQEQ